MIGGRAKVRPFSSGPRNEAFSKFAGNDLIRRRARLVGDRNAQMNQQTRTLKDAAPTQIVLERPGPQVDSSTALRYRIALALAFLLAVAAAVVAGRGSPSAGFEPQLILLIRFMALIKLGVAIGAAALVAWRLGRAPNPRRAAGYMAGTMLMAGGPALMWHMNYIIFGSILFYSGLVVLVILARADGVARPPAKARPRRSGRIGAAPKR
jgi:hypothetical protein